MIVWGSVSVEGRTESIPPEHDQPKTETEDVAWNWIVQGLTMNISQGYVPGVTARKD